MPTSHPSRWSLRFATAAVALALAACTHQPAPRTPSPASASGGTTRLSTPSATSPSELCAVDAHGLPTTCRALFGVSTRPSDGPELANAEAKAQRRFDLVYRFHDLNDTIPDSTDEGIARGGQLLHISIAARIFGGADVRYSDIIAGAYDDSLKQQGAGIRRLGRPVFLTFEQEGNQKDKAGAKGTPQEYRQAWRHVHDVMTAAGATNAVWVWVMMGETDYAARAGELWPGNDVVDWISWNDYNPAGCRSGHINPSFFQSFGDGVKGFYDWIHGDGATLGIDATKPMMISESGSILYPGDAPRTAAWYAEIPDVVTRYPQIRAVALWSGLDTAEAKNCDYRWQNNAVVSAGVASAGAGLR